jgi:hypothetical protein
MLRPGILSVGVLDRKISSITLQQSYTELLTPPDATTDVIIGNATTDIEIVLRYFAIRGNSIQEGEVKIISTYTDFIDPIPVCEWNLDDIGLSFTAEIDGTDIVLNCIVDDSDINDIRFLYLSDIITGTKTALSVFMQTLIDDKFLFLGFYNQISAGQMPNTVTGSSDYLTVSGVAGSEIYVPPDTDPYKDADTDYIWFNLAGTIRNTTTAELIGYDLQRTPVNFSSSSPYVITSIGIIKLGEVLTPMERDLVFSFFNLYVLWDNNLNPAGSLKDNRVEQNLFTPEPLNPVFQSAVVANATPNIVTLTYNFALDEASVPATGDFTVTDHTISSVQVTGSTVKLTLSTAFIVFDTNCYVTYTPGTNKIRENITHSNADSLSSTLITCNVVDDGYTIAWFDPSSANGRKHSSGVEEIWWNLVSGSAGRGSVENSGALVVYGVYEIITTEVNHFYTGCAIGDIFAAGATTALDANNTVKRVTGNHVSQPTAASRPVNQVFDGSNDFMKAAAFTFNYPKYLYIVVKAITWTNGDYIVDGNTTDTMAIRQWSSTPLITYGGASYPGTYTELTLNNVHLVRVVFAQTTPTPLCQVDGNTVINGSTGNTNAAGLTIGSKGTPASYANIQFYEGIWRTNVGATNYDQSIRNYLKRKWSTP